MPMGVVRGPELFEFCDSENISQDMVDDLTRGEANNGSPRTITCTEPLRHQGPASRASRPPPEFQALSYMALDLSDYRCHI